MKYPIKCQFCGSKLRDEIDECTVEDSETGRELTICENCYFELSKKPELTSKAEDLVHEGYDDRK